MSFAYDMVPYIGMPYPRTHPSQLAALAVLFDMEPSCVERCRVLELGCTDGGNLIPMALGLPGSEFLGIDLSARQVAVGQQVVDHLGLKNIELRAGDLSEIDEDWGRFDYIIAHGVYAWVPKPVRDAILRIASQNLAPQGVAFVSYNANPGGYVRRMFREMMLHHVSGVEDPDEKVARAKSLVAFLESSIDSRDASYRAFVQEEISEILKRPANVLFHDELSEHWEPVFFHQFIAHAAQHGLQFLAEADYRDMTENGLRPEVTQGLNALCGSDRLAREQYRDFVTCRSFRRTLLCHNRISLAKEAKVENIQTLYATSSAAKTPVNRDEEAAGVRAFHTAKGAQMKTSHPLVIALISRLIESSPRPIHFEELRAEFGVENAEPICEILHSLYKAGLVELAAWRPAFASTAGEFPEASPLARLQAGCGAKITTLNHTSIDAQDEVVRRLITLLDGTRDRAALKRELTGLALAGIDPVTFDRDLEESLAKVARFPLLVR